MSAPTPHQPHTCAEREWLIARVAELERLISDDAFAGTFQTLGQYRSALLKALRG